MGVSLAWLRLGGRRRCVRARVGPFLTRVGGGVEDPTPQDRLFTAFSLPSLRTLSDSGLLLSLCTCFSLLPSQLLLVPQWGESTTPLLSPPHFAWSMEEIRPLEAVSSGKKEVGGTGARYLGLCRGAVFGRSGAGSSKMLAKAQ